MGVRVVEDAIAHFSPCLATPLLTIHKEQTFAESREDILKSNTSGD